MVKKLKTPKKSTGKKKAASNEKDCLIIIDDDSSIREILRLALEKHYEVVCSPNGEDATNLIESHQPSLVILDINLPDTDGFKICQQIRAQAKLRSLPILFMTARRDDTTFARTLEAGGDSVITKPFEISEINERIEYLLKSYQS